MAAKKSTKPKALPDSALAMIVHCFRALSEPVRLLNTLMQGEHSVTRLVEASGSGQADVSKHLAVLRDAGMVGARKVGLPSVCFIADPIVNDLCDMMCCRLREEMEINAKALAPSLGGS